jgi:hypothetical protein
MAKGGQDDPLVVNTAILADLIDEWAKKFDKKHPRYKHNVRGGERMPQGFGGINFLAKESGLDPAQISHIRNKRYNFTTLEVADKIVQAMGCTDVWGNELIAIPNPRWSQEKWQAWKNSCEEN